jgi:hypothetical protein
VGKKPLFDLFQNGNSIKSMEQIFQTLNFFTSRNFFIEADGKISEDGKTEKVKVFDGNSRVTAFQKGSTTLSILKTRLIYPGSYIKDHENE